MATNAELSRFHVYSFEDLVDKLITYEKHVENARDKLEEANEFIMELQGQLNEQG